MAENFPNLKKETYPGGGSTESQTEETKETHTKTYHS